MRGSLYIGRVYTGPAAGVAVRPAAGLAVGVADHAGALWAVLAVLAAWFARFLVFSRSARTLI